MERLIDASLSRRNFVGGLSLALAACSIPLLKGAAQVAGPYTFLGLGLDHYTVDTGQRSDVIMISRVNPAAQTVRTLSIPRDLYVDIPGYLSFKINDAYNYGLQSTPELNWRDGADLAARTVTHNFGIEVDGVALTGMDIFPQVIDAIGGVTVNNPYDLEQPGHFYPAGLQTLDGTKATMFCRLRDMDGDGGRVMRQHLVLEAMLKKIQSPDILPKVPELILALSGEVKTTISTQAQAQLITLIPQLSSENLAFTNIEDMLWSGYTDGGAWIYEGDWSVLPGYVEAWLAGDIG